MAPIIQTELGQENAIIDQSRFGRRYAPDARDFKPQFSMVAAIRAMPKAEQKRRTQAPRRGPTLDQGNTPKCVMYSAATALGALPIGYGKTPEEVIASVEVALDGSVDLYDWSQRHDEWPGEDYEGTSVRAGQEYLIKAGRSSGYVSAKSIDEMKDYISRVGSAPIIIGIDYTEDMETPKLIKGKYYLEPSGAVVGGHAMCSLWFDRTLQSWKMQQTWGNEFGDDGIVYIPDDGMNILVFQWNGEAKSFIEQRRVA